MKKWIVPILVFTGSLVLTLPTFGETYTAAQKQGNDVEIQTAAEAAELYLKRGDAEEWGNNILEAGEDSLPALEDHVSYDIRLVDAQGGESRYVNLPLWEMEDIRLVQEGEETHADYRTLSGSESSTLPLKVYQEPVEMEASVDGLRYRIAPGSGGTPVGMLFLGRPVMAVGEARDAEDGIWYMFQTEGDYFFASGAYMQATSPLEENALEEETVQEMTEEKTTEAAPETETEETTEAAPEMTTEETTEAAPENTTEETTESGRELVKEETVPNRQEEGRGYRFLTYADGSVEVILY